MTFTVIDAPAPAGLISISTAAVPFMALYSTVSPDLVVFFSSCQPRLAQLGTAQRGQDRVRLAGMSRWRARLRTAEPGRSRD